MRKLLLPALLSALVLTSCTAAATREAPAAVERCSPHRQGTVTGRQPEDLPCDQYSPADRYRRRYTHACQGEELGGYLRGWPQQRLEGGA